MNQILLVDDEDVFRETLKEYLTMENYEITEAENGQVAIDIIKAGKKFDLILSDIQMPVLNGIDFLKWNIKEVKMPFVLMTGYTNLLETTSAFEIGATDFISKPFKCDELMLILKKNIPDKVRLSIEDNIISTETNEYIEIPVWTVVSKEQLDMDIYMRLGSSKFLKIMKSGQNIDVEKLSQYQKKGLKSLFLKEIDAKRFNEKMEIESLQILLEKKKNFINESKKYIQKLDLVKKLTVKNTEFLEQKIDFSLGLVYESKEMLLLWDKIKESPMMEAHSLSTLTYSTLLCVDEPEMDIEFMNALCISSLFHDVGETKIDKILLEKSASLLSLEEKKILEEHVLNSCLMLEAVPNIDPLVLRLISEHHENNLGTGFPQKSKAENLHDMSKVLIVSSAFSKIINHAHKHLIVSPINALNKIKKMEQNAFDVNVLLKLDKLVLKQTSHEKNAGPTKIQYKRNNVVLSDDE